MAALLRFWLTLAVAVLIGGTAYAAFPPRPAEPVFDQADIIPAAEEAALDQKLRAYNATTGRSVIVATVASLDGLDEVTYGVKLFEAWGIGGKDSDQGLLLLVAPNERRVRIEVGYGLTPYMTDALSGRIIRDTITPKFKAQDMAGGIAAGVDAITTQLSRDPAEAKAIAEAETAAKAQNSAERKGGTFGGFIFWIAMILIFMTVFGGGHRGRRYRGGGSNLPIILWGASEIARGISRGGGGGFGGGGFGGGGFGGFGGGGSGGGGASGGW